MKVIQIRFVLKLTVLFSIMFPVVQNSVAQQKIMKAENALGQFNSVEINIDGYPRRFWGNIVVGGLGRQNITPNDYFLIYTKDDTDRILTESIEKISDELRVYEIKSAKSLDSTSNEIKRIIKVSIESITPDLIATEIIQQIKTSILLEIKENELNDLNERLENLESIIEDLNKEISSMKLKNN